MYHHSCQCTIYYLWHNTLSTSSPLGAYVLVWTHVQGSVDFDRNIKGASKRHKLLCEKYELVWVSRRGGVGTFVVNLRIYFLQLFVFFCCVTFLARCFAFLYSVPGHFRLHEHLLQFQLEDSLHQRKMQNISSQASMLWDLFRSDLQIWHI